VTAKPRPIVTSPRSLSFTFLVSIMVALFAAIAPRCAAQMNMYSPVMEMQPEIPPEQLPTPAKMTGIGNVQMKIAAKPEAQYWFNQGLNLLHDFWDYESAKAFEQSIRVDPNCAMCYWGLYQAESFYHSTEPDYAGVSLEKAVSLESHASKRERLYISASAAYAAARRDSNGRPDFTRAFRLWRKLIKKYPRDSEARILLAYDEGLGSKEGLSLLESVLRDDPQNSAANHFYIHALEASDPARALHNAEILPSLAPNSGHMVHMPGHIYFRLGDYARAEQAFDASMRMDENYMREQHVDVDDDWNYVHNLMYAVANLMEEGKLQEATVYSGKLTGARGELDSTLYPFSSRDSIARVSPELPVALRTANWRQVITLAKSTKPPLPSQPNLRFLGAELAVFGAGMQAIEDRHGEAAEQLSVQFDAELWRMTQATKDGVGAGAPTPQASSPRPRQPKIPVMSDAYIEPLLSTLSVMSLDLRASILAADQHTAESEKVFAQAEGEEKALGYHEPPLYIRPVGEAEGDALMAAGDFAAAKAAYQKALLERPRSGFALYGIALCSERAGALEDAAREYSEFISAWKNADPGLPQLQHARIYLAQHPSAGRSGHTSRGAN
jgi:tetratricopeptide (TPR) repeat protein